MNKRLGIGEEQCQVLCECGDEACVQRVDVPLAAFADVQVQNDQFLVARGHVRRERERVVAEGPGYAIVEIAPAPAGSALRSLADNPAAAGA